MIIDQLNTHLKGGAGIAARRLHAALRAQGVDSRFWHAKSEPDVAAIEQANVLRWATTASRPLDVGLRKLIALARRMNQKWELHAALRGRKGDREIFTNSRRHQPTRYCDSPLRGDVLHLHWVDKLIDFPSFFDSLPSHLPIVWTLHDMNPFTGGCHHADECRRFVTACQYCPQLGKPGSTDLAFRGFRLKQEAYLDKRIHVVTPSRWLEKQARQSLLLGRACSIQTIHNGLNVQTFAPRDKARARRRWSLPEDRLVVGFGAASLKNRRKGFVELLRALALVADPQRLVGLAIGGGQLPAADQRLPPLRTTGYLEEDDAVADFYSALDLFVMTSMAENMPQTVVEALACGVPVVAFGIGGIPEIVQHMRTGLTSPLGDCPGLARHIDWLAEHPEARRSMSQQARRLAVDQFDLTRQANRYQQVYAFARRAARRRAA